MNTQTTTPEWIQNLEECITAGKGNAALIDWAVPADLFGVDIQDPAITIEDLAKAGPSRVRGWLWNGMERQMERAGWYCFFRSQGKWARPRWRNGRRLQANPDANISPIDWSSAVFRVLRSRYLRAQGNRNLFRIGYCVTRRLLPG